MQFITKYWLLIMIIIYGLISKCCTGYEEQAPDVLKRSDDLIIENFIAQQLFQSPGLAQNFYSKEIRIDPNNTPFFVEPNPDYEEARMELTELKKQLRDSLSYLPEDEKPFFLEQAGHMFGLKMVEFIFPHWYGTEYDYSGFSQKPGKGQIGCSYFVSTTLKHAGVNVDRYSLAQKAPHKEAEEIQMSGDFYTFKNMTLQDLSYTIREYLDEGLYFLGSDSHVGYVWYDDGHLIFIHADYINGFVSAEYLVQSDSYYGEMDFYLAEISTNTRFIEAWINGEFINAD